MSVTRQTTLWCDKCSRHIELDVDSVSHARLLASYEGWGRLSRHGDLCPKDNPSPRYGIPGEVGIPISQVEPNWPGQERGSS